MTTATALPNFADPCNATPEERTRAVAGILAAGLLRLRAPVVAPGSAPTSASENVSESLPNRLAVPPEKSVTVSAG